MYIEIQNGKLRSLPQQMTFTDMAKARPFKQHSVKVTVVTKSTTVVKCASQNSALHLFPLSHDAKYLFVVYVSLQSLMTRLLINII
jgi:hypothetical protein